MTQGYIVLATGDPKYLDMAVNLAASIRVNDPRRKTCLVCDRVAALPRGADQVFDDVVRMEQDRRYPHVMEKIRVFARSPYDSTMFVDADCLLAKDDVDHWWRACEARPFSITGFPRRSGEWKGVDIARVLAAEGADYLIQMNAGVFHFDRSEGSRAFFAGLERYYLDRMDALRITNYRGPRSHSFELVLGLYMGLQRMNCENVPNVGENSWMVSTWCAVWCDIEPETKRCIIWKGANHLFGLPFLPMRIDRLSPTFPHFVGLKPARLYNRLAAFYRQRAGL
ncbi:hypothetical protein GXW77_00765 [Roseomonas alkaliterrae]|uniref:Glycosyltransferase n=1 Tax=Neoroseomonas alkaliterrae TaxID=1452450 RepID=A0A840Y3H3_9PROT|nr:hypothetical protein [Neoroseomonas alkaliterrae]MBB5690927.1 hypothetical protein [Neoroseomonas alkaliterrae]MBR0674698.1 hypothetical protein [Neoroseomonas alkaliterrae]